MSKDFSAFLKGRLPKDVPPIKGQKNERESVDHQDKIKVFDDPSRLFPSTPRMSADAESREINGPKSCIVQDSTRIEVSKDSANTVEEPFKYRVNTVDNEAANTVEEPFKYRLRENDPQPEYRLPNRLTTGEEPLKNRLNTVEKQKPIDTLAGRQKSAFFFLVYEAKENGSWTHDEFRLTPPISSIRLAQALRAGSYEATRGATNALKRAQLLRRHSIKKGPGGFTVYAIPKAPYLEALNYLSRLNTVEEPLKNRLNTVYQTVEQTVEAPSSSSRNFLIKESTTTQLVDALAQIDLSLVQPFGITTSVLARCIELYPVLKPEQLEVLVFRFAEFAKDPKNRVQNARGFFISLAEQASKGQVPIDHIETPDERLMRSFIERQKEAKARRTDVKRAAQEFECEAWLESLTPEMKLILVPETAILKAGTGAHAAMLKSHFAENVWPERRKEILEKEVSL